MSESIAHQADTSGARPLPGYLTRFARRHLLGLMGDIQWGFVSLVDGDERHRLGNESNPGPSVQVSVNDPAFYAYVVFGSSVGAGQSYFQEMWDVSDLTALMQIMVRNREVLTQMSGGWSRVTKPIYQYVHRRNQNSVANSKRNISAHYDLGNDLFELMLDQTMMYSAGVFPKRESTLAQAQQCKLDMICQKLQLQPGDTVLEIGTGWGGFAIHAAREYGAHVTTTTISKEQFDFAQKRVQEAGLGDHVTLLECDYRALQGQYDKLVSIEMVEAVGHEFFDDYFGQVSNLLKPDGMALIQAITIEDSRFESYKSHVDFIKRFVFPGGCLPSVAAVMDSVARRTDMRLFHLDDIGPHYAQTLKLWWDNCCRHIDEIRALGYSDTFLRLWQFYLCYCEGAFRERYIGVVQLVLTKAECRRPSLVGGY